jgi:thiazole synthase ThiGH ThiG subunit
MAIAASEAVPTPASTITGTFTVLRMILIAMNLAVRAGRLAYLAGRIPRKLYATASSPLDGLLE